MRKKIICALMISVFLSLCACEGNGKDVTQQLQEEYRSLSSCDFAAKVCWEGEKETENYTLRCSWTAEEKVVIEVDEPEMLKGIRAEFDQEKLTLVYEDISLAAGERERELSPVNILPMVIDAIRNGYILERGIEEINGESCARILFEMTDQQGEKVAYTVWFRSGHVPMYAEVGVKDRVLYKIEFSSFSAQECENDPV